MHRLKQVNLQFAPANAKPTPKKDEAHPEGAFSVFSKFKQGPKGERAKPKGNFVDCWSYLDLDEYLTPAGVNQRKAVRRYMDKITPQIMANVESSDFPFEIVPGMQELKIVGCDMPVELGGKGMNAIDSGAAMYELARGDASVATFFLLHHSLGQFTVMKLAQKELRDRILKQTMGLNRVLAWALTEPENGSDASGMTCSARKVKGGYVLNGEKRWIGNATFADFVCVWARNESDGGRIQCFMCRQGQKGFVTKKIERKLALRLVQNAHIYLDDVFVADADHFELAKDFGDAKEVLAHSRITVMWLAIGIAAGATDAAFDYCQKRVQFKRPVAQFQLIQDKLVQCNKNVQQLQLMGIRISQLYDKGGLTIGKIAMAKSEATKVARATCQLARECMGGNGIQIENLAMKHLCDIEAIHTYEGTHQINSLVAGREMTGLAAFK